MLSEIEEVVSEEDSIDWSRGNFKPNDLCSQIKIMKAFEDDTNYKLKTLTENDMKDTMEKYIKAMDSPLL